MATSGTPWRRAGRLALGLALVAAALAALWAAMAAWVLPPWLKGRAEAALSAAADRPATIAALRIEPWTLAIEIEDLAIAARASGRPPLLRVGRARAELSAAASIGRRAAVIDRIEIDRLRVAVERSGRTRTDIDDLIERWRPAPPAPEAQAPPRLLLRRFELRDSGLTLDDRFAGRTQAIDAATLSATDLSMLEADADRPLQARLSMTVNGRALNADASATPFAARPAAQARLSIDQLDLAAFRADFAGLPLKLQAGRLSLALQARYEAATAPAATPTLDIGGQAALADARLDDAGGAVTLGWRELRVRLRSLQPIARRVEVERIEFDALDLPLARDAGGRLNLDSITGAPAPDPVPSASAAATSAPWQGVIQEIVLDQAALHWRDAGVRPAAALDLAPLKLRVQDLRLPLQAPARVKAEALLRAGGKDAGRLAVDGNVGAQSGSLAFELAEVALHAARPYLVAAGAPVPERGSASARGRVEWAATPADSLRLKLDEARLDDLALPDVRWHRLAARAVSVDLGQRRIDIGTVRLDRPQVRVARDARGQINLTSLAAPTSPARSAGRPSAPPKPAAGWRLGLERFDLDGGRLDLEDAMPTEAGGNGALAVRADHLALRAGPLRWPPAAAAPISVRLRGEWAQAQRSPAAQAAAPDQPSGDAGTDRPRHFAARGTLALLPTPAWRGSFEADRLPLAALARYLPLPADQRLLAADASAQLTLDLESSAAGWRVAVDGDASLADLRIAEAGRADDDLLAWRKLAARGIRVRLVPGERPAAVVRELDLTGVDGKLVVTEQGELLLATVGARGKGAGAKTPDAPAAATAVARPAPATAAAASAPADLDLAVGAVHLIDGRFDFDDHFIRPNYRAELSALNGQLGGFRSGSTELAPLVASGVVAGSGTLEISGNLNPTARPLALNLRARASGIDLPPLSAYSGKYAGYGISEGKLSVDLSYRIDADGRLQASNRIVLDRLTFGEPVESPSATRLPVRFLVALLKDPNGVIDINLPIEGSLDNPEFRLGPLIVEVLVKLLTRAVASPFAALIGDDGERASAIEFVPGTATPAAGAALALDRVAAMLASRPALTLNVAGQADPAAERSAVQAAALESRLAALPPADAAAPPAAAAAERERRLRQLYRQTPLPDKPRNAPGFQSEIDAAAMAERLRAAMPVGDDTMRELALQRALSVRAALIERGLASERLFVGAPVLETADGRPPRASLSLIAP